MLDFCGKIMGLMHRRSCLPTSFVHQDCTLLMVLDEEKNAPLTKLDYLSVYAVDFEKIPHLHGGCEIKQ